jgi:hypothetical protein
MALTFPISASIGQTYQSGSSNTYEWTGTYWKIKNVVSYNFVNTGSFNAFSASIVDRVITATNEGQFATTGSNVFIGQQVVSGSILISGSIVPSVGNGTFTSSFSLGSPTNAWKDLYLSHGSIIFVDSLTRTTSSFSITTDTGSGENTVQYTAAITASAYLGDGSGLTNLPSTTNWNKDKQFILRKTEQLTFSGDYILEDCQLTIEGSATASIGGEWTPVIFTNGRSGSVTQNGDNGYTLITPHSDSNGSDGVQIKRFFDTATTMSVSYVWSGTDVGVDRPYYDVGPYDPTEPTTTSRLQDINAVSESGVWTINVPSASWVAIGAWTDTDNNVPGTLQLTFPYIDTTDIEQYSSNKYFKKEGSIFIGGNLLVKDSTIQNDGKISVGGEVILIGNSEITGTGIII